MSTRADPHQRVAERKVRVDDAGPLSAAVGQFHHLLEVPNARRLQPRQLLGDALGGVPVLELLVPGEGQVEFLEAALVLAGRQQRLTQRPVHLGIVGIIQHLVFQRRDAGLGADFLARRPRLDRRGRGVARHRRIVRAPDGRLARGVGIEHRRQLGGQVEIAQQRLLLHAIRGATRRWPTT